MKLEYSDDEVVFLRYFAKKYADGWEFVDIQTILEEMGIEDPEGTLENRFHKLITHGFVARYDTESYVPLQTALLTVQELDAPPDYFKEWKTWLVSSRWRMFFVASTFVIPAIYQWVEIVTDLLNAIFTE